MIAPRRGAIIQSAPRKEFFLTRVSSEKTIRLLSRLLARNQRGRGPSGHPGDGAAEPPILWIMFHVKQRIPKAPPYARRGFSFIIFLNLRLKSVHIVIYYIIQNTDFGQMPPTGRYPSESGCPFGKNHSNRQSEGRRRQDDHLRQPCFRAARRRKACAAVRL